MVKKGADWRVKTLSQIRKRIMQTDRNMVEEMKYKKATNPAGIPVWYSNGMICTGETYKDHLRLTFAKGALLKKKDPKGLLNAHRAMIIKESNKLNETAFKKLIREAVLLNQPNKSMPTKKPSTRTKTKK